MDPVQRYMNDFKLALERLAVEPINEAVAILRQARLDGRQIFVMGNGGSAATASHFVCDLAKNTRRPEWPDFRVMGLADNMAMLSAYANDEGYENVFARQLANFMQPGDVVIGISASGNSPNVLKAIMLANQAGNVTIGLTGFDSGQLGALARVLIHVPSHCIEQVEDIHLMVTHLMTTMVRDRS